MGKKSRKNKEKKLETYSVEERESQINTLKTKLVMFGLGVYEEEMDVLYKHMDNFIKDGTEYRDGIKLIGAKRIMNVVFVNNKKYAITINLLYDENI